MLRVEYTWCLLFVRHNVKELLQNLDGHVLSPIIVFHGRYRCKHLEYMC